MTSAVFLVPKHPYEFQGGDTAVTRLLITATMEVCSVRALALWSKPTSGRYPIDVEVVAKPPVSRARLCASSLRSGRSLVHSRYRVPQLRQRLSELAGDRFISEHAYMAEAYYDSGRVDARERLYVNVHVMESNILASRPDVPHMVRRIEARRTRRDEARTVAGARSSAVFDETERVQLITATHREVRRLDLILPPAKPSPLEGCVAVFVGDRQWVPNAEAHRELVDLWPLIASRSPGSHLLIVGRPSPGERRLERADVTYAGFVDDIEAVWHRASLLLAPVSTGGGVRVKVLEAAAHGVPVVGYPSALGSIPAYLNIAPVASSEAFVDRAATLLGDQVLLSAVGGALHEEVSALWRAGFVQEQIISWLELN